jgi:hypothetical protein
MCRLRVILPVLTLFLTVFTGPALAQRGIHWRGSGGWGVGSSYNRIYNTTTVVTVRGEVLALDRIRPLKGMAYGVHLTLRTDHGTLSVHLGPEWYLENQDIKIMPKDSLEVTGSKIVLEGKPALIAARVKRGDEHLKLRDENGVPFWSAWRKRTSER